MHPFSSEEQYRHFLTQSKHPLSEIELNEKTIQALHLASAGRVSNIMQCTSLNDFIHCSKLFALPPNTLQYFILQKLTQQQDMLEVFDPFHTVLVDEALVIKWIQEYSQPLLKSIEATLLELEEGEIIVKQPSIKPSKYTFSIPYHYVLLSSK